MYEADNYDDKVFSEWIRDSIEYYEENYEKLNKSFMANSIGISYELMRKIINGQKKTTNRDLIIAICAFLKCGSEDTNIGLRSNNMPALDPYIRREDIMINTLETMSKKNAFDNPVDFLNENLINFGCDGLKLHRGIETQESRSYIIKEVSYDMNLYSFHEQYKSLNTEYSPRNIDIFNRIMVLEKKNSKKNIFLKSFEDKHLIAYTKSNYRFVDISNDKSFDNYFKILDNEIFNEEKKYLDYLNDTRNYNFRISAAYSNEKIMVFCEKYNYKSILTTEFFLMKKIGEKHILEIYDKSAFMMYYIKDCYDDVYKYSTKPRLIRAYESEDEIQSNYIREIYVEMKEENCKLYDKINNSIKELSVGLKNGTYDDSNHTYICNIVCVWEGNWELEAIESYGISENFNVRGTSFDDIHWETNADFEYNGKYVNISVDELIVAFAMGIMKIEEVCKLVGKYGSVENIL